MDKRAIILHNETLALSKIRAEYQKSGLLGAMRLCQSYMGLTAQGAYAEVRELCADLEAPES